MPITITCPECQSSAEAPDEAAGKRVRCQSCNAKFVAEASAMPKSDSAESRPATWQKPRVARDEDEKPDRKQEPRAIPKRPTSDDAERLTRRPTREDEDEERPRPRAERSRPRKRAKRQQDASTRVTLLALGVAVLIVGTAAGFAYFLGAFDSSKGKEGLADVGKPVQAGPQRPEDPIVEEIHLIPVVTLDGFGYLYDFKGGAVTPGVFVEIRSIPGGQSKETPLTFAMVKGMFTYVAASQRGAKQFDVWIAKRFRGQDVRADPVRVSNIIRVNSN